MPRHRIFIQVQWEIRADIVNNVIAGFRGNPYAVGNCAVGIDTGYIAHKFYAFVVIVDEFFNIFILILRVLNKQIIKNDIIIVYGAIDADINSVLYRDEFIQAWPCGDYNDIPSFVAVAKLRKYFGRR